MPRADQLLVQHGHAPTRSAAHRLVDAGAAQWLGPKGWTTLGDVGYVDAEGYLYLTDRKHHMIISGGVNIYPQECENLLITHPKVADAAVFGVPNADLGEDRKLIIAAPGQARPMLPEQAQTPTGWLAARVGALRDRSGSPGATTKVRARVRARVREVTRALVRERPFPRRRVMA